MGVIVEFLVVVGYLDGRGRGAKRGWKEGVGGQKRGQGVGGEG